jgi:lysine N6-hydroxylase
MQTDKVYDIIGIGIGPFNLGFAALTHDLPELDTIFIDQQEAFNWHPGLLLPHARLQVPFYADLVTAVDPTSKFSFMNYLHEKGRAYQFGINEQLYPLRIEYNDYCRWVASQLPSLQFGYTCHSVHYDELDKTYTVITENTRTRQSKKLRGKHMVIGTGSKPFLPLNITENDHPLILHSSNYLKHKSTLLEKARATIIGSGQSAAEIFHDLLTAPSYQSLHWYSRSDRFHPMDISKLTLELSSPNYIDHFYQLTPQIKKEVLISQAYLYKGINQSLLSEIYDQLYQLQLTKTKPLPVLQANTELSQLSITDESIHLQLVHLEKEQKQTIQTDALILATGYTHPQPGFLQPLGHHINKDLLGRFKISKNYAINDNQTIFIQNGEQHTHGFNSADLGLGSHRSATIINQILQRDQFSLHNQQLFQSLN